MQESYSQRSLKDVSNSMSLVFNCSASCDNYVSQLLFIFISLPLELPLPWQSKAILGHSGSWDGSAP